jgi:hypothetical protein
MACPFACGRPPGRIGANNIDPADRRRGDQSARPYPTRCEVRRHSARGSYVCAKPAGLKAPTTFGLDNAQPEVKPLKMQMGFLPRRPRNGGRLFVWKNSSSFSAFRPPQRRGRKLWRLPRASCNSSCTPALRDRVGRSCRRPLWRSRAVDSRQARF